MRLRAMRRGQGLLSTTSELMATILERALSPLIAANSDSSSFTLASSAAVDMITHSLSLIMFVYLLNSNVGHNLNRAFTTVHDYHHSTEKANCPRPNANS